MSFNLFGIPLLLLYEESGTRWSLRSSHGVNIQYPGGASRAQTGLATVFSAHPHPNLCFLGYCTACSQPTATCLWDQGWAVLFHRGPILAGQVDNLDEFCKDQDWHTQDTNSENPGPLGILAILEPGWATPLSWDIVILLKDNVWSSGLCCAKRCHQRVPSYHNWNKAPVSASHGT